MANADHCNIGSGAHDELIPGMGKITDHIKEQAQGINALVSINQEFSDQNKAQEETIRLYQAQIEKLTTKLNRSEGEIEADALWDAKEENQREAKKEQARKDGFNAVVEHNKALYHNVVIRDEEIKKLKEEFEQFQMSHPCDMNCEECGHTTTEDDLQCSLEHGSLICEGCFEEENEINDDTTLKTVGEMCEEIKKLKAELDKHQDPTESEKTLVKGFLEEIKKLKEGQEALDKDLVDMIWDPLLKNGFTMKNPLAPIQDHLKILVDDYNEKQDSFVDFEEKFLEKYIVANYYLPEHLELKDNEVDGFKRYVRKYGEQGGGRDDMDLLLECFREDDEDLAWLDASEGD
jgi:hypothetical protein